MPNYGTYAICPYYQTEDPLNIKCEGIVKLNKAKTEFVMRFPSKEKKKEWLREYCETYQYGRCPYAAKLEQHYSENGNNVRTIVSEVRTITIKSPSRQVKIKSKQIVGQLSLDFKEDIWKRQ